MAKQQKCPNCGRYRATERGILTKSLKCSYCGATSTPRKRKARTAGLFSKRVVRVNQVYVTTGGQKWERNWRNAREEALKRAGQRCTWCGAREDLHVHHKKPVSEGGTDAQSNLTVLCAKCHRLAHKRQQRIRIIRIIGWIALTVVAVSLIAWLAKIYGLIDYTLPLPWGWGG